MKRLLRAPNLMLATLWTDMLCGVGIEASVQRAWAGSIGGEIPPDQCLPEIWVHEDGRVDEAAALLRQWRQQPWRNWLCHGCGEAVEGPFEQCWNCGAERPGAQPPGGPRRPAWGDAEADAPASADAARRGTPASGR